MLRVMRRDTNPTHIPVLRGLATVMLAGVALFLPGGPTGAAGATDLASGKLEAGYEQQPARVGTPICSSPTACVVPFSLQGVSTRDVAGTFVQAGAGTRMADGSLYANSTLLFTGTVTGCGTGTVTMQSTGFNRVGVTSGSIEIIEGSGTDGLASLTGTGSVISGTVDPATGIARGLIQYRVKC